MFEENCIIHEKIRGTTKCAICHQPICKKCEMPIRSIQYNPESSYRQHQLSVKYFPLHPNEKRSSIPNDNICSVRYVCPICYHTQNIEKKDIFIYWFILIVLLLCISIYFVLIGNRNISIITVIFFIGITICLMYEIWKIESQRVYSRIEKQRLLQIVKKDEPNYIEAKPIIINPNRLKDLIKCPFCQKKMDNTAKVCTFCGKEMILDGNFKFCSSCGAKNPMTQLKCIKCQCDLNK